MIKGKAPGFAPHRTQVTGGDRLAGDKAIHDRLMARIAKFPDDHLDGSRKVRMMEQGGDEIGFFLDPTAPT